VATGLDHPVSARADTPLKVVRPQQDGAIDYKQLDRPTVIRNQGMEKPQNPLNADPDYLDIPAFLRRQAD